MKKYSYETKHKPTMIIRLKTDEKFIDAKNIHYS